MNWTEKKRNYLVMLSDPNCRLSRKKIADQLGVGVTTLRNWEKDAEFQQALADIKADNQEDKEWATLKLVFYLKALDGDVPAAKLWLQMREMGTKPEMEKGITMEEALVLIGRHLNSTTKSSTNVDSKN